MGKLFLISEFRLLNSLGKFCSHIAQTVIDFGYRVEEDGFLNPEHPPNKH